MEELANNDEDNIFRGEMIFPISLIFSKPLVIVVALLLNKAEVP